MNLVIPDASERGIFQGYLDVLSYVRVRLFVNNFTPDPATVIGDLVEATFPGYAEIDWPKTPPVTDINGKASESPLAAIFTGPTSGPPVNVYGVFIIGRRSGDELIAAARFSGAPRVLNDASDAISLIVSMKMFDRHQPGEPP